MARVKFETCFKEKGGRLYVRKDVMIGGVKSCGGDVKAGTCFGGIDWNNYKGSDLEATTRDGVLVIKGIY